jgi:hypothetical protein
MEPPTGRTEERQDPHRSVRRARPSGSTPGEHVAGVELIEQRVCAEVPKHATLNDGVEPEPVLGLEEAGFVKVSLLVVASGEDAVWDDHVEVEGGSDGA